MYELERIVTVEITAIKKIDDNKMPISKKDAERNVVTCINEVLEGIENVNVVKVQDFIHDSNKGEVV